MSRVIETKGSLVRVATMDAAPGDPPHTALSPAARAFIDDARLELIAETLDLVASFAISGREAAWRGDRIELGVHLRQLRECLRTGLATFNQLERGAP